MNMFINTRGTVKAFRRPPLAGLCSAREDRYVRKAPKPRSTPDARLEAVQLLGKWTRLSQGHVVLGSAGCSCGFGGANVRIDDFEQQILDYLRTKYAAAKSDSIAALLRGIASGPAHGDAGQLLSLLADLNRTLESFDELHRAG